MNIRFMKALAQMIAAVVAFLFVLLACWSVGYWLLPYLLHAFGWKLNPYIHQMANVLLGIIIMYLFVMTIMLLTGHKRRENGQSLIEAMERIAKGDFSVRLDLRKENMGPFNETHPFENIANGLNNMVLELQQLEHMRQEFVSNVSHEIQSPLTSIKGFARVLRNAKLSEQERQQYLSIIEAESERLSKLSDNLLKLASLDSERHPFELKRYRLDRQLSRIILSFEPQWTDKSIHMQVNLHEVTVEADEDLLSQVWVNLIHNAIKFSPKDGTITIELKHDGSGLLFRIADTGIGIAKEQHEAVFERFFKVDAARSREAGGSGLGLSLVKKIVELHHGTVQVESELGHGTAFLVKLPDCQEEPAS
ncbi:sensor histidine kinase [Paenibacillus protaetiae]|uniref:histidine kinase n=1 Tax=Paenibacillus protaetiae TaxID=2509456 RepID=A0A4P6ETB5_9BACL|nr:ATP-binding protein [Paenibacillus protaetiae]QAY66410.1 two-component sensor histidine kinase [Paenibacillus protaetiae]